MQPGKPSKTALRVAMRRAAHQLVDLPPVLDDPIAVRLVANQPPRDMERAQHKVARDFRASMAVRSRFVEDRLAVAVAQGVNQYVVLGAGLDTFAWRNPFPHLRVFEVDFPATQEWKRELARNANLDAPPCLTYVALDLEHARLRDGLQQAGVDLRKPAFFSWLGVIPYLTLDAFRATLGHIAQMPPGSGLALDYGLSEAALDPQLRAVLHALSKRVAAAGEPFRLFFAPSEMEQELSRAGFQQVEQWDSTLLNQRYFAGRADGLRLSEPWLGMLAVASV